MNRSPRGNSSISPHTRKLLMAHAFVKSKLLREIAERQATANAIAGPKQELEEILKEGNRHSVDLRRIASYLGHEWLPPKPTTFHAAKQIRAMIENGDTDEKIALYLNIYLLQRKKRGRPSATYRNSEFALRALELHDSDPDKWTWPKIADALLSCKSHSHHVWDSSCTNRVKREAHRLRAFLEQLQTEYLILP